MTDAHVGLDDTHLKILVDEYMMLQKSVEEFDAKALTIKAWSVTLSAAALVAAYVESVPAALLVGAGSAIAFWVVEALWKTNQQAFYPRLKEIEDWMAGKGGEIHPLQIARSWSKAWHGSGRNGRAVTLMTWPHVFMPHAAIVAAGVLLYLFFPPVAAPG